MSPSHEMHYYPERAYGVSFEARNKFRFSGKMGEAEVTCNQQAPADDAHPHATVIMALRNYELSGGLRQAPLVLFANVSRLNC
jgi:hypothetical protein